MTNLYKPSNGITDEMLTKLVQQGERNAHMLEQVVLELKRIEMQLALLTDEKIDEIGIGPQTGIRPDRIGSNILDRYEMRNGRHTDRINPGHRKFAFPRQILEAIHTVKGIGS